MPSFILNGLQRNVFPNPTIAFAERIVEEARDCSAIVSIGGGSTIDIGKYVSWKLNIHHTAIPTTAGTGSEATRFAVFWDNNKANSLENDLLLPDAYVLDPERIITLSPLQTASTGLDALSQAIESWWSPLATKKSRYYSYQAFHNLIRHLWQSYHNPQDQIARKRMLEHANYSGQAINITKTSVCHAISYPLTALYGIPHGIACIHTLPFFMRYFGLSFQEAYKVEKIIRDLGVKITGDIDKELVAKEAMTYSRIQNTPKPVNYETILRAL